MTLSKAVFCGAVEDAIDSGTEIVGRRVDRNKWSTEHAEPRP